MLLRSSRTGANVRRETVETVHLNLGSYYTPINGGVNENSGLSKRHSP